MLISGDQEERIYSALARIEAIEELERLENAEARQSIFPFIKKTFRHYKNENWHHKVVSDHYQKAFRGEIRRLMVFIPPRHMKTEGLERATSWGFGDNPDIKVINCAYAVGRAKKSSRNVKANIKDRLFSEIFPEFKEREFFDNGSDTQTYWEIGGGYRGSYLAAGVGGGITGEGFNVGIIDDPIKSRAEAESPTYQENTKDWYDGTFLNRQDEEDSVIILINTRWNRKDLSGQLLMQDGIRTYNGHKPSEGCPDWNGQDDGIWDVLCLPAEMDEEAYRWKHPEDPREIGEALWPSRFPTSFLEQFKRNKYDWTSLYQGRPKPKGGNIINREWFKIVKDFPRGGKLVRFWDLASTPKEERKKSNPDFTAGALMTYVDGILYIIDVKATRISPKARDDLMKQTAIMDDAMYGSVMQVWEEEGGASGKDVTVKLNKLLDKHLRMPLRARKSKNFYIDLLANKAETGNVCVVEGPWLWEKHDGNTFFDNAEAFPSTTAHDDDIDAAGKAAFVLTNILRATFTSTAQAEEYKKPPVDEEIALNAQFKAVEQTLVSKGSIDDEMIETIPHIEDILENLARKYVDKNDDQMADIIYDQIDRLEANERQGTA